MKEVATSTDWSAGKKLNVEVKINKQGRRVKKRTNEKTGVTQTGLKNSIKYKEWGKTTGLTRTDEKNSIKRTVWKIKTVSRRLDRKISMCNGWMIRGN